MSGSGVHVYGFCFNNEMLLPYFLRHYQTFCDRIVIVDFHSTDRSAGIVKRHPFADLRLCGTPGVFDERTVTATANRIYRESRGLARWVIVVDMDELLYHPALPQVLRDYEAAGVTLPKVQAYQMVHPSEPCTTGQLYEEITEGFPDRFYNRRAIFHPDIDIRYRPGCDHGCDPAGPILESNTAELKLLHFNFFGPDRWVRKYQERAARMSMDSRLHRWGTRYCMIVDGEEVSVPLLPATDEALRSGYRKLLAGRRLTRVV